MQRDTLANPGTINGKFDIPLDTYLDHPDLSERSNKPIPFEEFIREMAFKLRDLEGTWKTNQEIINEISEMINFMRVLQPGGVSLLKNTLPCKV